MTFDPYSAELDPGSGVPIVKCDCGDCDAVMTDCCNGPRWECEIVWLLDANGDRDVRVCRQGFGCTTELANAGCPWTCPDSRTCACAPVPTILDQYADESKPL